MLSLAVQTPLEESMNWEEQESHTPVASAETHPFAMVFWMQVVSERRT